MSITIVIYSSNTSQLIKENLPAVLRSVEGYKDASVIVVDDGSTREDVRELRKVLDLNNMSARRPVSLIEREKNDGLSSALNAGVKAARGDVVVLLSPSAVPRKGFLELIPRQFEENSNLFSMEFADPNVGGEKKVERRRRLRYWRRGFMTYKREGSNGRDPFWNFGGSIVVRRELFNKLEGFDELYNPFSWENVDLLYRAQKMGWEIECAQEGIVAYRDSKSGVESYSKRRLATISHRNQFIFHWKNITQRELIISHVLWLPYHMTGALIRWDTEFMKGFLLAVRMMPAIMRHRKKHSKLYMRSDKDIIS